MPNREFLHGCITWDTKTRVNMLRLTLISFAISVVAGVLQFTQFTGDPVRAAETSLLLSLGFLISFIVFLVFGLLALGSAESDSNSDPITDGIMVVFGWR